MEIVLLRHGEPRIDKRRRLSAASFGRWIDDYSAAGIEPASRPPVEAIALAQRCAFVVCSNLPRSYESALALGVPVVGMRDVLFRELDTPHANWHFPRLRPGIWAVFFRLIWVAGHTADAESVGEARARARRCAERLATLATEHGSVLFVGHAALNWLIDRQLKRLGWRGPSRAPREYWEYGVYRWSEVRSESRCSTTENI